RAPRQLTVSLDADRLLALDRHAGRSSELDLSKAAMRATVEPRQTEHALDAPDVTNRYHLEAAVVDPRPWRDEHRATQVGAVSDGARAEWARDQRPVVQPDRHSRIAMDRRAGHRGGDEVDG